MKEGHEPLTAFRTQYGMFESLVVRDGLRNAPAVFQHFLNDVFKEVLGRGVIVYIDDILIHAATVEELRRLTRKVFEIVRQANLYLKASKCEFEVTSMGFLGFIISHNGVEADASKVEAIRSFPRPSNLRESRSFIGLTSYYRRFVPNFSRIAGPITSLTQKNVEFTWGKPQEEAFVELKRLMSEAPVIRHFDPKRETILQTDASYFGWGFIISQIDGETREEHPIAIESGRFTGAQLNYTTTEKEFMAIVEAFKRTRHMLLQVSTTVVTDHLNLTFWMEPRQLTPRQARWVELLSPFRFKIVCRPGKQATMPDALSRRADYHPGKGATTDILYNYAQALPNFAEDIRRPAILNGARVFLRALQRPIDISRDYFVDDNDLREGLRDDKELAEVMDVMMGVICGACDHSTCKYTSHASTALRELRRSSRNPHIHHAEWNSRQFLTFNKRIYIPNIGDSRLKIIRARHDSNLAGHPGISKTIELISRDYVWIGLRKDVELYVSGCIVCQRTKPSHAAPSGLLKTLEVPSLPWSEISMDFIEQLPESDGHNSILVVVDRLTKWAIFIPTHTSLTSGKLADLLFRMVFSLHGLPTHITSDRGSKFVSKLWRYLMGQLGVNLRLSTAYHPQTDGQTERVNQVLEQYLRVFTSYNQDDWSALLAQASFAYNNSIHSAIKSTPFYANFGYHPRWIDELKPTSASEVPEAKRIAESIIEIHETCAANIAEANASYSKYYDAKRKEAPNYQVGDKVMLSMENIRTRRPMKKLDVRQAGPYEISEIIGERAVRLKLPKTARIHDVFHVGLLRQFSANQYPGQRTEPQGQLDLEGGTEEYEVSSILDSRLNSRGGVEYLVEWLGYEGSDKHTSWEPSVNVKGAREEVNSFHTRYPDKPRGNRRS